MKKKQPAKRSKPTPAYDSKRQQNVLLDKIYSEVKAVGEGHSFLSDKIDGMDRTLREIESKSFGIEMDAQGIKSKIGTLDIKIDRVERATIENSRDIKALKEGQQKLEEGQGQIKQKLDTVAIKHEQRLHKLETA